ncbi:MAG TPA: NADP-dependent glyceraldehyde-3-phosphate dehydrogenase, partial [Epulopiscium sp.]|nr:NADP-dependent glyceraldehyde-3-phosphate dehydrogenase [Candidatus Epulonipiscium sp.]
MFKNISSNGVYKNLYNGQWVESETGKLIEIYSPIDHSLVGKVQAMGEDEVDKAIKEAKKAQESWADLPLNQRADLLYKAADILLGQEEDIADIMVREIAKDYKSAISEVRRTVDFIKFTADAAKHIQGETSTGDLFPGYNKQKISFVTRVPLGTVLAISPFNYPVNLSASKIAPALVGGNSVILKPPTQGAISALYLAEAFNAAGLPKGLLQTVTGKGSVIGDYVVTHKDIDFINFTGSTAVGRRIAEISTMKPLLLELGGKDPAIVLSDADLDETSTDIVAGAFSYSGQRCTAVKRILIMDDVADALIEKLKPKIAKIKTGSPVNKADVTVIPLISNKAADFVQSLIDEAIKKGAKVIAGNKREGNLIYPTLIDQVTTDMKLAWEEPFGPVLPIIRVKSIEEAIEIANNSEYGLQSSVFTKDIDLAFHVAQKLEVGTVQVNNKTERGPDHFPFLGVKSSGMGTQGVRYSIEAMTRPKAIVLNLNK